MSHRGAARRLRALRAIVRMELRELVRHRGRSLLILILVAVPVAAVVGGTTLVRIVTPTDEERRLRAMGQASLRVAEPFEYDRRKALLDALPASAGVQSRRETGEIVRVAGREIRAKALALGPTPWPGRPAGLATGSFVLLDGRVPLHPGEVALSPALLEGIDRKLGDRVILEYGGARTIVGIVAEAEALRSALVLRTAAAVEHRGSGFLLVGARSADDAPDEAAKIAEALRALGFEPELRSAISGEGGELAWAVFVLGTIGFLEAGLVIASTFIVGLRRRQYSIGLLGSTGATGQDITLSLLGSTGMLAVPGVAIGATVGAAAVAAVVPFLDRWNDRLNGPFELAWDTVIAALVLGVVAALVSTTVPAWAAGRMPIREALGGRRPIRTPSGVWLVLGLGMVGTGLCLVLVAPRGMALLGALAAIVGSILGVLGFGVCSPFVLDVVGRRAGRLPLRWRLALRDAGRFRARNGPVVTAVLAGMSMSVTVAVFAASLDRMFDALPAPLRDDQLLIAGPDAEPVAAKLMAEFEGLAATPLTAAYLHGEPVRVQRGDDPMPNPSRQWVGVGDETTLRALAAESGRDPFLQGILLQVDPPNGGLLEMLGIESEAADEGTTFTTWRDGAALDPLPIATVAVDQNVLSPAYLLHRSKLEGLGWEAGPPIDRSMAPWLVRFPRPVDSEMLSRAQALAGAAVGVTVDAQLLRGNPARGFYHAVLWLCVFTGLVVVLVATALSSVESAADSRILQTVGASPGLVRGHHAARAAYLAFLGCALAIPAGIAPAIVIFDATNIPLEPVIPWFDLLLTLLALPALAYGLTWLAYRAIDRHPKGVSSTPRRAAVCLVASLCCGSIVSAGSSSLPIRWEPFEGTAFDGSPLQGELGRIEVPVRHGNPAGPSMEIAFVRYRTRHPDPGPPIFYLAGGPGGSGVELSGRIATHPQLRFLEFADVIGIDQRGTGLSLPELRNPSGLETRLSTERPPTRDRFVAALTETAHRTANYWRGRGIDIAAYNSRESADDLDAVRRALGLPQVTLYGASYGSHLGLAYLRRHPGGAARAVLAKVEGPDHTWKLPATVQRHLERLHRRCARDPRCREALPDLIGTIRTLRLQLEKRPATIDDTAVGAFDLQRYLASALSTSDSAATIPRSLVEFSRGEWGALAETVRENRTIGIALMPWATDCASGASPARQAAIRKQAQDPDTILGDAILAPFYPEACEACRGCDLGETFRSPPNVDVPVLFVSGTHDVRTPPENVEEIADGFSNHGHIVVERAGHESRELMSPEYRALLQAFLRGEPVASATVALPPRLLEWESENQ